MLRWRRGGRGDRGASAVEFAIIVPVLLLIILGIIEFAFLMRDYLSVSSAVKVGTRVAAAASSEREALCPVPLPEGMTACAGPDTPQLAQSAADAIQRAGTAMPQDSIDEIWVYRANTWGFPANDYYQSAADPRVAVGAQTAETAATAGCTTACVRYRWNDARNKFVYVGGSWNYRLINACVRDTGGNPPDAVGVYMRATHPFFTGLFQATIPMEDRSVMSFEPLPAGFCAPLAHN